MQLQPIAQANGKGDEPPEKATSKQLTIRMELLCSLLNHFEQP